MARSLFLCILATLFFATPAFAEGWNWDEGFDSVSYDLAENKQLLVMCDWFDNVSSNTQWKPYIRLDGFPSARNGAQKFATFTAGGIAVNLDVYYNEKRNIWVGHTRNPKGYETPMFQKWAESGEVQLTFFDETFTIPTEGLMEKLKGYGEDLCVTQPEGQ